MSSLNNTIRALYLRKFGREAPRTEYYWPRLKELVEAFGQANVGASFKEWIEAQSPDSKVSINTFIDYATGNLHEEHTEEEIKQVIAKESADLDELCIFIANTSGASYAPYGSQRAGLNQLLQEFSLDEIKKAYKDFVSMKDDYDMKFAVKNFCEGAGRIIILSAKKKAEEAERMKEAMVAAYQQEAEMAFKPEEEPEEGI